MTSELTAAEFLRADLAFDASNRDNPLFVTPVDTAYAMVGCEGCNNAKFQTFSGAIADRVKFSIGVGELADGLGVPYNVVETHSRSSRGGRCKGACKLLDIKIEDNPEGVGK